MPVNRLSSSDTSHRVVLALDSTQKSLMNTNNETHFVGRFLTSFLTSCPQQFLAVKSEKFNLRINKLKLQGLPRLELGSQD